jgi:hypothetical protein
MRHVAKFFNEIKCKMRLRSPHHFPGKSEMRTSEPKPHQVNKLLVSFDSEVRKRACLTMMRTSESGY